MSMATHEEFSTSMKNEALQQHSPSSAAPGTSGLPPISDLMRAHHLALALDCLGQPLVVLCCKGDILHASPQALGILAEQDGLMTFDARLHASVDNDDAKLQSTLNNLMRGNTANGKPELLIHRPSGKSPYKVRITPFRMPEYAPAQSINGALLLIHDAHANHAAWQSRLRDRFRLTPRECECTALLAEGYSLPEIAERMGVTTQTLRQHLKHAMQKTGTHKQHELAGLVMQMHRKR